MRSLSKVILFGAIVTAGLGASTVSATTAAHPIHLVKDCSTMDGVAPTFCTISASDVDAIPVGTKVWYLGPVLTNSYFLSSNVRLDDDRRNTATGYCIFQSKTAVGLCSFWEGTGRLTGFVAILDITIDEAGQWHMDGSYYFDGPRAAAAAP
jgi:hypothetical protein